MSVHSGRTDKMISDFEPLASILARRAHLRALFVSQQFAALDALLEQQSQPWLSGVSEAYDYEWSIDMLFDPLQPVAETLAALEVWVALHPDSYHAHLLLGCYWERAAGRIRTQNGGDYVTDDRWMGAELARDSGIAAYLRALPLHPKPAYALFRIFRLSCYLGEPQWLFALALGEQPDSYTQRQSEVDPEVWAAGMQWLREEGGSEPAIIPQALPACLSPRSEEEQQNSKLYWLRLTLDARPNLYTILSSWVHFLYPRWGGSHQEMSAFIDSDWCRGLTESERNGLRMTQAWDYLGYVALMPEEDDRENIAFCLRQYDALLALNLTPRQHASVLRNYANFLCHYARTEEGGEVHWNKPEMQRAYDALVKAWQVDHPVADPGLHDAFSSLLSCLDFAGIEDSFGLRPMWLDRSQQWGDCQYEVLVAGLASKYGFYGIRQGQFDHERLIPLGLALESDLDIGQAGANLFESVSEEAGIFLTQAAADAGDASAMAGLYDLYSGRMSRRYGRDATAWENREQALAWMERAADAGNVICQYNLGYVISRENEIVNAQQYQRARDLFIGVMNAANVGLEVWQRATRELSGLILFNQYASDADRRFAVEEVLSALWNDERPDNQEYAAAYYAHAFFTGSGCVANRYLAKVWVDRGLAISPQDEYLLERAGEIYQRGALFGGLRSSMAFRRDKARMDEHGRAMTFDAGMGPA
ncbi:DUF4034 domain-containing protein [Erwinia rhapontici]|uniref:DUF4034 domain-containing protein n=1 Tax=Erwinia rhapontici TaxID=55212 RepID=UPI003BA07298